jgi:uncharacterized RDD family membrane protein YckC
VSGPPSGPPDRRGQYAGIVSRFVAFVVDVAASSGVFMLTLAAASFAASVVTGKAINWNRGDVVVVVFFAVWEFVYFGYSWAANGKTFGAALLGIQVVGEEGAAAGTRRGIVRVLAFPLSFLLCGLGFLGILLGRQRRALHDVLAGTAVVYTWDARAAQLRFLARNEGAPGAPR